MTETFTSTLFIITYRDAAGLNVIGSQHAANRGLAMSKALMEADRLGWSVFEVASWEEVCFPNRPKRVTGE